MKDKERRRERKRERERERGSEVREGKVWKREIKITHNKEEEGWVFLSFEEFVGK
jgi:hypothetical protein